MARYIIVLLSGRLIARSIGTISKSKKQKIINNFLKILYKLPSKIFKKYINLNLEHIMFKKTVNIHIYI